MMEKRFESKVDGWLVIVFLISAGATLVGGILAMQTGGLVNMLIGLGIIIVGSGLPVWLFYSTAYIVSKSELKVRCGPVRVNIPLNQIQNVEATRNPLSSPALSLDRLKIIYGAGKSVMISPKDKQGFLKAIGHSIQENKH